MARRKRPKTAPGTTTQGTPELPDSYACNECMTGEWQAVRALGMDNDR
jgi:hypothetical protein